MLEMGSYALTGNSTECVMHCHIPVISPKADGQEVGLSAEQGQATL